MCSASERGGGDAAGGAAGVSCSTSSVVGDSSRIGVETGEGEQYSFKTEILKTQRSEDQNASTLYALSPHYVSTMALNSNVSSPQDWLLATSLSRITAQHHVISTHCYNHVRPYLFSLISMDLRLRCLVLYLLSLTCALISDSWTSGCVALYLYLALTPYDSASFPFLDISALLTVYEPALNHHSHPYISSSITMLFFTLILLGFT
jgi:hypothetical protein